MGIPAVVQVDQATGIPAGTVVGDALGAVRDAASPELTALL